MMTTCSHDRVRRNPGGSRSRIATSHATRFRIAALTAILLAALAPTVAVAGFSIKVTGEPVVGDTDVTDTLRLVYHTQNPNKDIILDVPVTVKAHTAYTVSGKALLITNSINNAWHAAHGTGDIATFDNLQSLKIDRLDMSSVVSLVNNSKEKDIYQRNNDPPKPVQLSFNLNGNPCGMTADNQVSTFEATIGLTSDVYGTVSATSLFSYSDLSSHSPSDFLSRIYSDLSSQLPSGLQSGLSLDLSAGMISYSSDDPVSSASITAFTSDSCSDLVGGLGLRAVPEPSSFALSGLGALTGIGFIKARRRSAQA